MFSRRIARRADPNRLLQALEDRRSAGGPVLDLTESNPTRAGFSYAEQEILAALADPRGLEYRPDPRGLPEAREAVAGYYRDHGVAVDPGSLVLASGTSEAYGYLFKLLAQPGDEVLVPKPGYPLLEVLTALDGVTLVHYPLVPDRDGCWRVDLDRLENTVSTRTVAIVVVSPNNPTGSYLKRAELERMADIANRFGLALIVDEVFSDYGSAVGCPDCVRTAAGHDRALTFVLNGLSKTVALPQVKLGWIRVSGPPSPCREALERLEFIADAYLSVSAGVQHAAGALLRGRARIQAEINARLEQNESLLRSALHAAPAIRCPVREGGWYAVLDASAVAPPGGDEEMALDLLSRDGVFVHPGYFYDFARDGHLVVSLLTPPDVLADGAARIAARLG